MASGPITSCQIEREKLEAVIDFVFLGSILTADSDYSHEIERSLLLGRKAVTTLHSILKSKDITLPANVHIVKAMVFPVVMYRCERWTIKKAEHWRTDAVKQWWWRRLLRALWTARGLNQSILKEIKPEYSLEVLMLKLKLQYFGHLMRRPWCWETLMMKWLGNITKSTDMNLSKLREMVEDRGTWSPWGQRVRHNSGTEQQQAILVWGKFRAGDSGQLGLRGKEQPVSGARRRKVRSDSDGRGQDTLRKRDTRGSASIYSQRPWTLPSPTFCGPSFPRVLKKHTPSWVTVEAKVLGFIQEPFAFSAGFWKSW